jgi:hypothetical protein
MVLRWSHRRARAVAGACSRLPHHEIVAPERRLERNARSLAVQVWV